MMSRYIRSICVFYWIKIWQDCQWFIDERIEGQLHGFNKHKLRSSMNDHGVSLQMIRSSSNAPVSDSNQQFESKIWTPNSNFQNSKLKLSRTVFEHLVNPENSKLPVQSKEKFAKNWTSHNSNSQTRPENSNKKPFTQNPKPIKPKQIYFGSVFVLVAKSG